MPSLFPSSSPVRQTTDLPKIDLLLLHRFSSSSGIYSKIQIPLHQFSSSSFSLIFFFFIDFSVVVHRFASALLLQLIFIDLLLHRFSTTVHRFASATVLQQSASFRSSADVLH
ncbi:hypothetical protein L6452_42316 [Arctium lappa]|uniref:Uncharacterized protein n=1 Tax=Arctium lappa TaxID=4217 RepID=A0ACB8XJ26_ARCLA|nr:hypothetical protein L6452_42316 [Arctium lappa]